MGKINLIIIRHGETDASRKGIWSTKADIDLNENGRQQAISLGSAFASSDIKVDKIICSSLLRTRHTAKILAERIKYVGDINAHDEFKELNSGLATGLTDTEVFTKFPEIKEGWKNLEDPRFPDGENFEDVEKRMIPVLSSYLEDENNKTILFVGHKTVNMIAIGYFLHMAYTYRYIPQQDVCHASYFKLKNGKAKLKYLNLPAVAVNSYSYQ